MDCRTRLQLLLDINEIYTSIDAQVIKTPHVILVHMADLDNERNPDIGTLKKDMEEIFGECWTKSFEKKILRYVNGVLFEMIKISLKGTYLRITPTALQNEISTCRKCNIKNRIMLCLISW